MYHDSLLCPILQNKSETKRHMEDVTKKQNNFPILLKESFQTFLKNKFTSKLTKNSNSNTIKISIDGYFKENQLNKSSNLHFFPTSS